MSNIILIQDIIDNKISLRDAQSMAISYKNEVFTYFDEGCTRYVFVNKDKTLVIKLEKNDRKSYNKEESGIYKSSDSKIRSQMVRTELVNGFIEQDFVLPIKYGGKRLSMEEIRFAGSCRNEVGWTEDGRLLCFDLDEFKRY